MRNLIKLQRLTAKLNHEFGSEILSYLYDPEITEVALNCDGNVWIKHRLKGYVNAHERMEAANAYQLIGSIANRSNIVVNEQKSRLVTELPDYGYRFVGFLPPTTVAPSFVIRKPSRTLYTLDHYIDQGVFHLLQADIIREAILMRESILIAGGPGTGKTTFANALLNEMVRLGSKNQRFVLIEETRELKCTAPNKLYLKTSEFVNHDDLLRDTLIASPNKIIVGECRGKEMLTLLKAWNTGTQGGLTTIHANSARGALQRVADMVQEAGVVPSPYLISESINMVITLDFNGKGQRIVKEIAHVMGYEEGKYVLQAV